ncbi:MAG: signal peptidase [Herbinix sp.]|jgi:signal peptidase|nr:signal peptidase [Herbinix sp.]
MKKRIYGAFIGIFIVIAILNFGSNTNGAPVLTYVYSNSMEPLIKVNDAFIVWHVSNYQVGDIIMYRPVVLEAPYITHRIIAVGEEGFITKGDNSSYEDQESGEPEVITNRVIGKVITFYGQPIIIPGLGKLSSGIQEGFRGYTRYLSWFFLILGVAATLKENRRSVRRPKTKNRLRLRHIYKSVVIISILLVMLSIYLGSRVSQVKYLVSEYPGTLGDQIEVNKPGKLTMVIKNNGLIPVWTVLTGIAPLDIYDAPEFIRPRSKESVILTISPQRQTGRFQGYVQVYNYPTLLPRNWIVTLHRLHPAFAITVEGLSMGLLFTIFFRILNHIHGFEDWIPLRAMKDKIVNRRLKRAKAKLLGRRRVR